VTRNFGLIVAKPGKRARRGQDSVLDTDVPQFKYYEVLPVTRIMPAGSAQVTIQIPHGLPYEPSFVSYMKGYNGNWGLILRGAQAVSVAGYAAFPYSGTESIDSVNYNLTIFCTDATIPAHPVTIRLIFLYDEAGNA
jgi:hypothetical protein